jgi:hypothetical protein
MPDLIQYGLDNRLYEIQTPPPIEEEPDEEEILECHVCGTRESAREIIEEHACDRRSSGLHCADHIPWFCYSCGDAQCGNADERWNFDDEDYCLDCYSDTCGTCDSCNYTVHRDNLNYSGHLGADLCDSCYSEEESQYVHDYGYKPSPQFHGHGPLFMGVELEVDGGDDVGDLAEALNNLDYCEENFYQKHDGSLSNGIEIVTHPATIQHHLKEFPWMDILKTVKQHGFKSHNTDTCGLHVHVSRRGLGRNSYAVESTIDKLIVLLWRFETPMFRLSRRDESSLNQWSAFNHNKISGFRPTKAGEAKDSGYNYRDRYMAINTQPDSTIEFRLFKGTLKLETLKATLQLVDNLVMISQQYSIAHIIRTLKWSDVVNFNPNYRELKEYAERRRNS